MKLFLAICSALTIASSSVSAQQFNDLAVLFPIPPMVNMRSPWSHTTKIALTADGNDGKILSDCKSKSSPFVGKRVVSVADWNQGHGTVAIYDINGNVAGMQMMLPVTIKKLKPMIKDGGKFYLTAYFIDPAIVCDKKQNKKIRNELVSEKKVLGDKLRIQLSRKTEDGIQSMTIPNMESPDELESMKWTKGKFYFGMGMHYWYDLSKDMDCDGWFAPFLLYDYPSQEASKRKLTGYGWVIRGKLVNENFELPPQASISKFMDAKKIPSCLAEVYENEKVTSQHVYLDNNQYKWVRYEDKKMAADY